MLARLHKMQEEREEGFTLIELLVVIIIIGILAAIAIPVFLSQRQKGYDSAAKSDLKNMSIAEESYLTDNPAGYSSTVSDLQSEGFNESSNVDQWAAAGTGASSYILTDCSQSGKAWQYSSTTGTITTTGSCTF
jgi:type IV pilus assembly protein PilA